MKPCERSGCPHPAKSRGLCRAHYDRERHRHRSRPDRLIANRARQRAVQSLIKLHREEFKELYAHMKEVVAEEVERHREAMPDAPDDIPRLMPGPRGFDQDSEDRIQVVQRPSEMKNCPRCRHMHAINHECPNCSLSGRRPVVPPPPKLRQSARERVRVMLLAGKKPTWIIDQGESRAIVNAVCAELEEQSRAKVNA